MVLDKLPTRRYFITIFLIVLALFMAFSGVIYRNYRIGQNYTHSVLYNYEMARLGRKVLFDLVDMETGVRGYLLTHDRAYLQPYLESIESVNTQIQYLYEYSQNDPYTKAELNNWLKDMQSFNTLLTTQIENLNRGKTGDAAKMMSEQKEQMDHLRSMLEASIAERLRLLDVQRNAAEQSNQDFLYILVIGTMMSVGSTLLAITIILSLLNRSRHAEAESRTLENRFIAIMSGVNDGVFDLNVINDEIYYSPSYKLMLGYEDAEFPNVLSAAWDAIHPDDIEQTREVLQQFLEGSKDKYFNIFRMQHRLGHWIWIMSRGVGIRDTSGKIVRLIGTHTDITEQKKREEQLANLNSEMEAFTYITSHDLRSPLVNLKGFAKEMSHAVARVTPILEAHANNFTEDERKLLHDAIDVDIKESLGFIEQSVVKMDTLTTAVLDLSRIGKREYRVEPVDLNQVTKRCLDTMAYEISRKQIKVSCQDLPEIQSDPLALEQVISNVIDNAIKYLDPNRPGTIDISYKPYGSEIILTITDNGRGIAKEDREKVFQIFRRARNSQDVRGLGMGMAYVQATVRKLQGAIWFTSVVGEGTTFFIRLPKQLVLNKGSNV